ncbi:MAG: PaaI family thioesterase [Eubacterium sp.]|nr:PaaI family thioesterase [Eubacterium sp.]
MEINEAFYQRILERRNAHNPFANLIGIVTTEIREGYAKGYFDLKEELGNAIGSIHGGCLYALADTVVGAACASYGYVAPTVSGSMNFLSTLKKGNRVWAEATTLKHGKKISVFDVRVTDEGGKLLATATFTYYHTEIPLEAEN